MSQTTYRAYQPRMPAARRLGSMASETHTIVARPAQPAEALIRAPAGMSIVQPQPVAAGSTPGGAPSAADEALRPAA